METAQAQDTQAGSQRAAGISGFGPKGLTPRQPTRQGSAGREFLTFRLGNEEYAIEILRVQEIRSYEEPTRIANSAACVKGVLNLRGNIVPVMDLRQLFGLPAIDASPSTVTIVLNNREHRARLIGMDAPEKNLSPIRLFDNSPENLFLAQSGLVASDNSA